jgi:CheY-like chemotaxis protein
MIPIARLDESHEIAYEAKQERCAPRLQIFVVEDDADTADSMATLLHCWGFEAVVVRNGFEALQRVQGNCPDVVLLDLAMPGMHGIEVAKRLRQQLLPKRKIPFLIAVSGYGDAQTCRECKEAGIDLHLVKPVDLPALQALLNRFQRLVMPAAERRTSRSGYGMQQFPTLHYLSDRAMLNQCLVAAMEIRSRAEDARSRFRVALGQRERWELRSEWCRQVALYLDQTENMRRLLASFQKWEIYS